MKAKYVNPFTDFGFKKIFGEEASKPALLDFLNSVLPQHSQIRNLSFKNTEQLGIAEMERRAVYDIYCEAESGEKFIVELQKAKQNYFKDRTVYYSTFPIREQAEKGDWNFKLTAVYCIGILDFTFNDYDSEVEKTEVIHTIKLKDQHGKVFFDKLTYIYLEMPNFHLHENELVTRLDKWLYFIKNLEDFQSIPEIFKGEVVFETALEKAALSTLNQDEYFAYEQNLKVYRDNKNVLDTAREEGEAKGLAEGEAKGKMEEKQNIARQAKSMGLSTPDIAKLTGLSEDEINNL